MTTPSPDPRYHHGPAAFVTASGGPTAHPEDRRLATALEDPVAADHAGAGADRDVPVVRGRDRDLPAAPSRVLAVMCAGMFLVLLDVTIVNVALPSIGHGLRANTSMLQWVVDGYVVAIAGLLLAGGTIGDRAGHRRVLLAGFAVFGAASLVCAVAPTAGVLVAARVVQGVGGALLLPSTMAMIVDAFPDRRKQARALGMWAAVSSLALPLGPLLGGVLVGGFGWRPVFWINVPLIMVAVLATLLVVPARSTREATLSAAALDTGGRERRRRGTGGSVDLPSLLAFVIGLGGLVFTVISVGHHASAPFLAASASVTAGALALALVSAKHAKFPILPLDLLRRPRFLAPNVIALSMNLVFNGLLFVSMLYLQDVLGFSPLRAGVTVLPMAIPLIALAPVSGRLTARFGPRPAVALGCVLATAGSLLLTQVRPAGALAWLLSGFTLLGCGAGLVTASVVAAVVRATPADRSGLATGVSNTARQIGTACGVAIFGAVAGTPSSPDFVPALHALAVVAAGLWAAAFLVAMLGIES
ncbi:MFS transporter [Nocardia jejuensis]|uniref:MFS transporter n=1 Tax=Nocardia jejuensis TaxID=328049 RepID=UPI000AFB0D89|nr:MFS transporter [Nocardia jejuensis]